MALESLDNRITSHIMSSPEHAEAAMKGLQKLHIRATFCYSLHQNPAWKGSFVDIDLVRTNPNWRLDDARRIKEKYLALNRSTDLVRFGPHQLRLRAEPFRRPSTR